MRLSWMLSWFLLALSLTILGVSLRRLSKVERDAAKFAVASDPGTGIWPAWRSSPHASGLSLAKPEREEAGIANGTAPAATVVSEAPREQFVREKLRELRRKDNEYWQSTRANGLVAGSTLVLIKALDEEIGVGPERALAIRSLVDSFKERLLESIARFTKATDPNERREAVIRASAVQDDLYFALRGCLTTHEIERLKASRRWPLFTLREDGSMKSLGYINTPNEK
jgi:hypothetical protein